MKFDDIIEYFGDFGPYQKRIYFLLCVPITSTAIQMLLAVFTLNIPEHRCSIPGFSNTFRTDDIDHDLLLNYTIPWEEKEGVWSRSKCERFQQNLTGLRLCEIQNSSKMTCESWEYDRSVFENTVVTEFNMVCDDKALRSHANMLMMAGVLVGAFLLGLLADMVGRKIPLMIGIVLHAASGIGSAFAPNYAAFVALRFVNGASNGGLMVIAFVLGMEFVGPQKRAVAAMALQFFWCSGLFILGAVAYGARNWHYLQLGLSIPPVLFLSYWWLIPESPRWLLSRGRTQKAIVIFKKMAKVNSVSIPVSVFEKTTVEDKGPKAKMWEMFTSSTLLVRSLVILFNWLVCSSVFYGLGLNVGNLSGDIYLNFTIANIVELVAYILCILLLDRVGRKWLHCSSMFLGGVACIATLFPVIYGGKEHEWITITLSMVGKMGISGAFAIIYVFSHELFPTVVRSSGMGASSLCARVGGMVSPYVADLGTLVEGSFGKALPLLVFGALTVAAGLLALMLPETFNRKLPETIEDAKGFGRKQKSTSYDTDHPAADESELTGNYRVKDVINRY